MHIMMHNNDDIIIPTHLNLRIRDVFHKLKI